MVGEIDFGALSPGFNYAQAIQSMGAGQQRQDQITQNALQQAQLKRQTAADARAETQRQAVAGAVDPAGNIDYGKLKAAVATTGDPTAVMSIDDHIRTATQAKFAFAKSQNDATVALLGGVKDEASYQAAKVHAAQLGLPTDNLPQHYDPAAVGQLQQQALTVQQQLEQHIKEQTAGLEAAKAAEAARHNRSDEGLRAQSNATAASSAAVQATQGAQRIAIERAKMSNSLLDQPTVTAMAQQALSGDKSVFTGLGRGSQGAQNIALVRAEMTRQMRDAGMTGAQIAAKNAEYVGTQAGARATGALGAKIDYGVNEMAATIPLAIQASNNVPRGSFMPFTKVQQMIASGNNDPALKDFAVKTQAALNAYNMVAARGGSSVGEREHNATLLSTANSPAAYQAALNAMAQEGAVAKGASKQTMDDITGGGRNRAAGPPAPSKVIRYDADGNRIG